MERNGRGEVVSEKKVNAMYALSDDFWTLINLGKTWGEISFIGGKTYGIEVQMKGLKVNVKMSERVVHDIFYITINQSADPQHRFEGKKFRFMFSHFPQDSRLPKDTKLAEIKEAIIDALRVVAQKAGKAVDFVERQAKAHR
ncbi:MAG: hypothetical protein NTX79_04980 [Candidatus Micrarchaeota archaeon]|nr:hypothetical protein [Candidatus Micrarchaeota archaeon]